MSLTFTTTTTFTVTHAKYIASKVATDLKRLQRLYGKPTDSMIAQYEQELIELMKGGYFNTVTYGYHRNGNWIEPTLRYTAQNIAVSSTDDDPGRIRPGADVTNAVFYSYLTFSTKWFGLSTTDRQAIEQLLPFIRTGATEPGVNGYLTNDLNYTAGGRALARASVRS